VHALSTDALASQPVACPVATAGGKIFENSTEISSGVFPISTEINAGKQIIANSTGNSDTNTTGVFSGKNAPSQLGKN
jgi:hypothetical protein